MGGQHDNERITGQTRTKTPFQQAQTAYGELEAYCSTMHDGLRQARAALRRFSTYPVMDAANLTYSVESAAQFFDDIGRQLHAFMMQPDANTVYWLSQHYDGGTTLHAAPLHVGRALETALWNTHRATILTSATLTTHDGFGHIAGRLNATHFEKQQLHAPFNYKQAALILVPTDIADPSADRLRFQTDVERALVHYAAALDGHVMALFTSFAQVRQTAQAIAPRLGLSQIQVFDQSDGSSRDALLSAFKTAPRGILLGTRSFWDGIDLPAGLLRALVIVKLPFAVPSDPVFAARSETYQNTFADYALPDAVLRFRQGFGRLIRRETDKGVVIVLDTRIIHKGYGSHFMEVLPDCEAVYAPLETTVERAVRWINPLPN
jgi:DNA polymerase-3 subunit epsilon/ATP-dependent DNA helicase DinG